MNTQTFKYTDDGKKVVVIAQLNAKETIVQEIFVSAGQEVPSGENFVVKNLHDAPAISWKEKNLAEIEQRYKRRKLQIEQEMERLDRRKKDAQREASAFIKEKLHWRKNINIEALNTLFKFLNDEITHIVTINYGTYEIRPFKNALLDGDNYYENLKLISLFGTSEGNLDWKLNHYRDGSGGYSTIIPCSSMEEAQNILIKAIQENSAERGINQYMIDAEKKYGVVALTNDQKKDYYIKCAEGRKESIVKLKLDVQKLEAEFEDFMILSSQAQPKADCRD